MCKIKVSVRLFPPSPLPPMFNAPLLFQDFPNFKRTLKKTPKKFSHPL